MPKLYAVKYHYVKHLVSSFVSFSNSIKVVSITGCYIHDEAF